MLDIQNAFLTSEVLRFSIIYWSKGVKKSDTFVVSCQKPDGRGEVFTMLYNIIHTSTSEERKSIRYKVNSAGLASNKIQY